MTHSTDATGSRDWMIEKVELSRWFEEGAKYGDAIAAVESELQSRYGLEEIDNVEAETMMSGHWRVTVVGILDETERSER